MYQKLKIAYKKTTKFAHNWLTMKMGKEILMNGNFQL